MSWITRAAYRVRKIAASALRMTLFAALACALSSLFDFELRHVWYASVATTVVQLVVGLWLLRREFVRKLERLAVDDR